MFEAQRCRLLGHKFLIIPGATDDYATKVVCRRCDFEERQVCPYCPEPLTMIPNVDRERHDACFQRDVKEQVLRTLSPHSEWWG